MHHPVGRRRQKGAVIITVALLMLFMLGFMGFALDLSRLFVVKSELQTAMDSCALSAAQELDGLPDALDRARSTGLTAGNLNRVNFQSDTWSGQGQLTNGEITFLAADLSTAASPAVAKYVECRHVQPSVQMWLLQAMGTFFSNPGAFPNNQNVMARAVATRGSSQSTCPVPLALRPRTTGCAGGNCGAPNYGFAPGDWVTLLMGQGAAQGGEIGWANLDGTNSASETEREMLGSCGTRVGDTLGTPGVQSSIADAWNFRFGIYKNTGNPAVNRPDETGYIYTGTNWPNQRNAFNGSPGTDPTGTADHFVNKRLAKASCANNDPRTNNQAIAVCEALSGVSLNSFQKVAAPGTTVSGGHLQYGISRRIVLVPVVNTSSRVIDYACMLMLQPLSIPMTNVQLEFIDNPGAPRAPGQPASPCTTTGIPGGVAGPLVPVLVR
jgi:hypothetical protein